MVFGEVGFKKEVAVFLFFFFPGIKIKEEGKEKNFPIFFKKKKIQKTDAT